MKKVVLAAAMASVFAIPTTFANDNAKSMAEALSGEGLGTVGGTVNPDKGNNGKGTASDVSGGGNGGWGNIGSTLTGGQVSSRPESAGKK